MLRLIPVGRRRTEIGGRSRPQVTGRATRRQARPVLESLEGRQLMTLTPISPNAGFPYTTGVELQITFPDNKHYVGSGVMVDSYHVLTAGHVVYSYADGGFATSIIATPELNGTTGRFGSATMTHEITYNTWINYSKAHPGLTAPGDMDIALMSLNKNIGNSTGWMSYGYNNNNNNFSAGSILNTFGYPAAGGYNGQHEELSSGSIAGLSSDGSAIEYYQNQITTYGGSSGSPVYQYISATGSRVVYGIVVGGSGAANSENFATRITQSIFNDIGSWIKQDNAVRHPGAIEVPAVSTGSSGSTSSSSPMTPSTPGVVVPTELSTTTSVPVPLVFATGDTTVTFGLTVPSGKAARSNAFRFVS
jgi:V8-like Glu-specific endopeptidase